MGRKCFWEIPVRIVLYQICCRGDNKCRLESVGTTVLANLVVFMNHKNEVLTH